MGVKLADFQVESAAVPPGDSGFRPEGTTGQEDGVVGTPAKSDEDFPFVGVDPRGGIQESAKDLSRLGVVKSFELAGQFAVGGVGNQGEHEVEVNLNGDSGAEGVEVEEVDVLSDAVFDQHAVGVTFDEGGGLDLGVVGQDEGGLFSS